MPYAFVTTVEFTDDDHEVSRSLLTETLIPNAKGLPGFQSGVWLRAGRQGMGTVVFDTEENARSGQATLQSLRPADGPRFTSETIYEVMGQA
jgi:hypothetical protein